MPYPARPFRASAPRNSSKFNRPGPKGLKPNEPKKEPEILFQTFFKSVGPRTYAAQVKKAGNGNQFIVLTEGKRDDKTGEVRKTKLFVFSEDFEAYFALLRDTVAWVKAHPMPAEMVKKREAYWAKQAERANTPSAKPHADAPPRPMQNPRSARVSAPGRAPVAAQA